MHKTAPDVIPNGKMDAKQGLQKVGKNTLYNYPHRMEQIFALIDRDLSKNNATELKRYDRYLVNLGIQQATRLTHLQRLLNLSRRLKKDWKDATKEDIDKIVYEIMDTYSEGGSDTHYTYDHKKILKLFFRWLKFGSRDYKFCLKKFRIGDPPETEEIVMKKPKSKLRASDLITDEERQWLLEACESSRDKALIDVGLDGGIRPAELLTLTIGNIKQDKYGYIAYVDGKTGTRPVRLIQCTPSLARWLSEHPFRENSKAPLWINFEPSYYGQALSYSGARSIIQRINKKVTAKHPNFNKRVFLYLFRHTEATKAAKKLTDAISKKRHGWTPDSKMNSVYEHLNNDDVDKAVLESFGIKSDKELEKIPITCPRCKLVNHPHDKQCSGCGQALDLKTAIELEEKERETITNLVKDYKITKKDVMTIISNLKDEIKELKQNQKNNKS